MKNQSSSLPAELSEIANNATSNQRNRRKCTMERGNKKTLIEQKFKSFKIWAKNEIENL